MAIATVDQLRERRRSISARFGLSRRTDLLVGACIVAAVALLALLAPVLPLQSPVAIGYGDKLLGPLQSGHVLGTDQLGRDVFSRLVWGSRSALYIAFVPTLIGVVLGGVIGLTAGYRIGVLDTTLMRVVDVMFAFPSILLALGIAAGLGPSVKSATIAIGVVNIPVFARVVRASTLSVRNQAYVEVAQCLGLRHVTIVARHIVPNVAAPVLVYGSLQTGRNVLLAASLSFLGLGAQPPAPDWGLMLSDGRQVLATAPLVATIPGLAILLLTIGFNMLGDGLRDVIDPRAGGG